MLTLLLDNRQRTGAILAMTRDTIKKAVKEGDLFTFSVAEHKTVGTYGSAVMGCDTSLMELLKIFEDVFR